MLQSRYAYGFSKAFMLTGNVKYLNDARRALDFQRGHAVRQGGQMVVYTRRNGEFMTADDVYGGKDYAMEWYDTNENELIYMGLYLVIGPEAYFEATGDQNAASMVDSAMTKVESFWDSSPGREGYYMWHWLRPKPGSTIMPGSFGGKGFSGTVDGLTTCWLNRAARDPSPANRRRVMTLVNTVADRFIGSGASAGFPEEFSDDWVPVDGVASTEAQYTYPGHVLKASWVAARAALMLGDHRLGALAHGYLVGCGRDKRMFPYDSLGPITHLEWKTGIAKEPKMRTWWCLEQGVLAGLVNYELTHDMECLEISDRCMSDLMRNFWDDKYGEFYAELKGNETKPECYDKGTTGKAAYHSIELLYLSHVYTKLFVRHEPVTLYYYVMSSNDPQTITVMPCELPADTIKILSVVKDGKPLNAKVTANKITVGKEIDGVIAVQVGYSPRRH
jgi:hypothetical protein